MESKTENLSVGQSIKNYKELCLLLDERPKTGKSKQLQIKDWKRYFRYNKEGNKYIITEIYSEPEEKVNNRGKSEGSRNNNEIYGQYVDQILLNYFADCEGVILYATTNQLSFVAGLINSNYSVTSRHKDKYYNYSYEMMNGVANKVAMWDFFEIVKTSIKSIIGSSLKRLADKNYINYEETHMLIYNNQSRAARDEEEAIIRKIENSVLEEMQVTRNKLLYNDKLRNEYYADVEKLVLQEIAYVDKLYVGYKIKIKEKPESKEIQAENRAKINELFKERTKKKLVRKHAKTKEKFGNYIGQPNPFWGKFTVERLNFNYLIYVDYVIKSLLSSDFKDIREAIVKQKIVSPKKMERKQMVKTFIDNDSEEDREMWESVFKEE